MNTLARLLARVLVRIGDWLALLGLRMATAGLVRLGVDLSTPPTLPASGPPAGWTVLDPVPPVPPAGDDERAAAVPQMLH